MDRQIGWFLYILPKKNKKNFVCLEYKNPGIQFKKFWPWTKNIKTFFSMAQFCIVLLYLQSLSCKTFQNRISKGIYYWHLNHRNEINHTFFFINSNNNSHFPLRPLFPKGVKQQPPKIKRFSVHRNKVFLYHVHRNKVLKFQNFNVLKLMDANDKMMTTPWWYNLRYFVFAVV